MEWAIELCKSYGKPIAATMAIGPKGDRAGVPAGECAVTRHHTYNNPKLCFQTHH